MTSPLHDKTVAIIGLGLLGASLGMALKQRHPSVRVIGWARRQQSIDDAVTRGMIDSGSTDPAEILPNADISVICVPLQTTIDFVTAHAKLWRPGSLVTDVGSVKTPIVTECRKILADRGVPFIGSHPMAGSHNSGLDYADGNLYTGAVVFVTAMADDDLEQVGLLEALWTGIDARPWPITPDKHDALTARTSHALHLVAAAAVRAYLNREDSALATGGAFRDFSRIAGSSADMWVNISEFNQDNLVTALKELEGEVAEVRQLVASGQWDELRHYLDTAKDQRQTWFEEWSQRRQ